MSTGRYRTLAGEGTGTFRDRGSRFLGIAFPISDEDAFRMRLAAIAREHHDARHHCYAWVSGVTGDRHRADDAGEPKGTAGAPVLRRVQAAGLTFTAVVVVRWFGGTLLGKGGLVRAYGEAARLALEAAPVVERTVMVRLLVWCGYAEVEELRAAVAGSGGAIIAAVWTDNCALEVELPTNEVAGMVTAWTARGIRVQPCEAK